MRVCALIPAYNVEAFIATVVEQTRAFLPRVYVVDDGSTDQTAKKARASGAEVLRHPTNRGKGHALRTGFQRALEEGFHAVVTLDADGQHDPHDIPSLLECAARTEAPIVVGARVERETMPLHRRLNNGLVSSVGRWLCGQPVLDFQCGFRFLSAEVLRAVTLETGGYETESELLIQAGRLGFRIENVPIRTIYAGQRSHVHAWREMRRFTRLLFRSLVRIPPRLYDENTPLLRSREE